MDLKQLFLPLDMSKTLGEEIRNARKRRKMSQEDLARAVGLSSKSIISKYEKNITFPSFDNILPDICKALDVEIDFTLTDLQSPSP